MHKKTALLMKKLIILLIFITASVGAYAQATNDAGLWTTLNFEKKLKKNFAFFVTEEFRLRENFTRLNLFYTDLGFSVQPVKFLKVSLSYRNIEKYAFDNTFSFRHRLMLDIVLKKKAGMLALSYRQRIQSEVRDVYVSEHGHNAEWYSRNKFEIKFDLDKKITPYVGTEFRFQIKNARAVESDGLWHRARYFAGLDYQRNKRDKFGFYYLIQNEYNVSAPQNLYIIGLEYSISL